MSNCAGNNSVGGNWLWILILLFCCGGCGNGFVGGTNCENGDCSWIIILILLLFCCGGNCGNGCSMCEA